MGYHKREIKKGVLGQWSKIEEEWAECADAHEQENSIMELVELSDLLGAIDEYVRVQYMNITIEDVLQMTRSTQGAFRSGDRK